ncbi:MAG: 3-dehydroquinate synthase [Bacteroidota bacterium]|nr:3-dehydroquinate synthase [Bacteroidota bacterium]
MEYLQQSFSVPFNYRVWFSSSIFNSDNPLLAQVVASPGTNAHAQRKILFVFDQGLLDANPGLPEKIRRYFAVHKNVLLVDEIISIPGGESAKNDESSFRKILNAVDKHGIDRHSFVAAVGGGAVLDTVGYAAAVAHRGVKHIRIPGTVLSQNDSGVGVKNGINYFGKKNFLGTFAPPFAVINDDTLLNTLSDRHWRSGISEAVKVALIKDAAFFEWLDANAESLANRNKEAMAYLVRRCAQLHLEHIASADPFESGSSRPLDFGHWSAHKLEQLSRFDILHGEAVALGIALDSLYSVLARQLTITDAERILHLLERLGFDTYHPLMAIDNETAPLLKGLQEFREHLGGELTIMLLDGIGKGVEVHSIDTVQLQEATKQLAARAGDKQLNPTN